MDTATQTNCSKPCIRASTNSYFSVALARVPHALNNHCGRKRPQCLPWELLLLPLMLLLLLQLPAFLYIARLLSAAGSCLMPAAAPAAASSTVAASAAADAAPAAAVATAYVSSRRASRPGTPRAMNADLMGDDCLSGVAYVIAIAKQMRA